jgi:hypothetical protein
VAQHGAGELGKETLDEVEPGAMRGREGGCAIQAVVSLEMCAE